jgi:rod shape-determining protein MreB
MTAERIKKEIGTAKPPADGIGLTMDIKGRDLINGVPKEITHHPGADRRSAAEPVRTIVEGVRIALENTQLAAARTGAADIVDRCQGIVLTGGGANRCCIACHGGSTRCCATSHRSLPVRAGAAEITTPSPMDPLTCVALGTGRALARRPGVGLTRGVLTTPLARTPSGPATYW